MRIPKPILADLALVGVTIVWGSSFAIVKQSLSQVSPLLFIAIRFTIATVVVLAFMPRAVVGISVETARRGGLQPPFSCERGKCATCMAHLDDGSVTMRANNIWGQDDLDEGWILTCQSVPTSVEVVVNYDA